MICFFAFEDEVTECFLLAADDSSTGFIVGCAVAGGDVFGEEFLEPWELDGGGEAEVGGGFSGFDFCDFAGDEGGGVPGAGLVIELSAAVSD